MQRRIKCIVVQQAAASLLSLVLLARPAGAQDDAAAAAAAGASPAPLPDHKPADHRQARASGTTTADGGFRQLGQASWYGTHHLRKRTASGERFDPAGLTAAHPTLPMNTRVKVTNLANHKQVTVTINDRSKQTGRRVIDLSPRAADALGMKHRGVVTVAIEVLPPAPP